MLKTTYLFSFLILMFIGCVKRYKFTGRICDNSLFVEFYEVNQAGVDAEYLTDSNSFRMYVGKFDPASERYKYECRGDSIYIEKMGRRGNSISDTVEVLMEKKVVDLKVLKKLHKFE